MADPRDIALDQLGKVGLEILVLSDGFRKVMDNHRPGAVEYYHAEGAIAALDILADRAVLLLTALPTGRPANDAGPMMGGAA